MNMDTFNLFRIYISTNVWPFLHYENLFACSLCLMGKNCAKKSGSHNQIIILFQFFLHFHHHGTRITFFSKAAPLIEAR